MFNGIPKMAMLYLRAGKAPILPRCIKKNELCLVLEAFLDNARGRPALSSARRTKDGAMSSEKPFRLDRYRAFLSNIDGP